MKIEKVEKKVKMTEGVSAELKGTILVIKGPKGEISYDFPSKRVLVAIGSGEMLVTSQNVTKREKTLIGTYVAHIKNMMRGVVEPFVYKLKVCASHFPMTVKIDNGVLTVKNFIGEAVPRKLKLKEGADVKVDGQEITVIAVSKETAGQVAADIEQLTKRPGFDRRIFQDGIYITQKDKKQMA
jgi:large subunit ribosomal protein L6